MFLTQFTCTNLDGSQKEGGNFLNLLQKEWVPRKKGGVPQKRVDSNPGVNYVLHEVEIVVIDKADLRNQTNKNVNVDTL